MKIRKMIGLTLVGAGTVAGIATQLLANSPLQIRLAEVRQFNGGGAGDVVVRLSGWNGITAGVCLAAGVVLFVWPSRNKVT